MLYSMQVTYTHGDNWKSDGDHFYITDHAVFPTPIVRESLIINVQSFMLNLSDTYFVDPVNINAFGWGVDEIGFDSDRTVRFQPFIRLGSPSGPQIKLNGSMLTLNIMAQSQS